MTFEELSYYIGYNTEKEAVNFLKIEKGGGIGAKSAIFFNQLIDNLKLQDKYEKISVGEKIRNCYIQPNEYGISVIGFKDFFPAEFKPLFTPDYATMFQKMVIKPLESFTKLLSWRPFNPMKAPSTDIFELK